MPLIADLPDAERKSLHDEAHAAHALESLSASTQALIAEAEHWQGLAAVRRQNRVAVWSAWIQAACAVALLVLGLGAWIATGPPTESVVVVAVFFVSLLWALFGLPGRSIAWGVCFALALAALGYSIASVL